MSTHLPITALGEAATELLPKGAAALVAPVEASIGELSSGERDLIRAWTPYRQREFATGRMCARRALSALGFESGDLLPDAQGLPLWPKAAVGSISHCRGVAMAVVAHDENCALIGVDIEKTSRLSAAAIKRVMHPLEQGFVAGDQVKASILFSLKEAFYKAQFPRWRTTGNFHDLALGVDMEAGSAQVVEIDARFAPNLAQLRFGFRLVDDYVVSLCWS